MDELDKALFELLTDGLILGKCPQCTFPLSVEEIKAAHCEMCGPIDFDLIVFLKIPCKEQLN